MLRDVSVDLPHIIQVTAATDWMVRSEATEGIRAGNSSEAGASKQ
jgi:hypothetical protein